MTVLPFHSVAAFRFHTLDNEAATTLYAASRRLTPFNSNSPTSSTSTAFSTFVSTRGLIKTCPGFASSHSRCDKVATARTERERAVFLKIYIGVSRTTFSTLASSTVSLDKCSSAAI